MLKGYLWCNVFIKQCLKHTCPCFQLCSSYLGLEFPVTGSEVTELSQHCGSQFYGTVSPLAPPHTPLLPLQFSPRTAPSAQSQNTPTVLCCPYSSVPELHRQSSPRTAPCGQFQNCLPTRLLLRLPSSELPCPVPPVPQLVNRDWSESSVNPN